MSDSVKKYGEIGQRTEKQVYTTKMNVFLRVFEEMSLEEKIMSKRLINEFKII